MIVSHLGFNCWVCLEILHSFLGQGTISLRPLSFSESKKYFRISLPFLGLNFAFAYINIQFNQFNKPIDHLPIQEMQKTSEIVK